MIFVGIDPGQKGGFAMIDENRNVLSCFEMPQDITEIYSQLKFYNVTLAVVEQAQAMPKQGVVGIFTYGTGYGKLLAAMEIASTPYQEIRPKVWKKAFGLHSNKLDSINVAEELFPTITFMTKGGRMLDGKAEALLLADYARQLWLKELGSTTSTISNTKIKK